MSKQLLGFLAVTAALTLAAPARAPEACPWQSSSSATESAESAESAKPAEAGKSSLYEAAVAAIEAGDYEGAIKRLQALLRAEPDNADAYSQLGYANSQLQNYQLALANYRRALEIDPEHPGAHGYIGKVYLELDEPEKAEAHLRQLDLICLYGCEPYFTLKEAIELYRANQTG